MLIYVEITTSAKNIDDLFLLLSKSGISRSFYRSWFFRGMYRNW